METLATLHRVMMEIPAKLPQATMGTRAILPRHPIRQMTAGEDDAITTRSIAIVIRDADTITEGIEGTMLLRIPSYPPLNHLPLGHLQLTTAVVIEDTMYAAIAIVNMGMTMIHPPLRLQEITVDVTGPMEEDTAIPEMRRRKVMATVAIITTERATEDITTDIITATMERKSFRRSGFSN